MSAASRIAKPVARPAPPLAGLLRRVRLAPRQVSKGLTLWPLVLPADPHGAVPADLPDVALLDDAMEDGFVGVGPAGGDGRCPVETRAPVPVLVLGGEPVGGAGVATATRLLPARGRSRLRVAPPAGRGVCPRCLAGVAEAFRRVPDQVGFAVAVHERMAALDLLLPAPPAAVSLRRRLRAWAPLLMAREAGRPAEGPAPESPEAFLEAAARLAGEILGEQSPAGPAGPDGSCSRVALRITRTGPLVHVAGLTGGSHAAGLAFV